MPEIETEAQADDAREAIRAYEKLYDLAEAFRSGVNGAAVERHLSKEAAYLVKGHIDDTLLDLNSYMDVAAKTDNLSDWDNRDDTKINRREMA